VSPVATVSTQSAVPLAQAFRTAAWLRLVQERLWCRAWQLCRPDGERTARIVLEALRNLETAFKRYYDASKQRHYGPKAESD